MKALSTFKKNATRFGATMLCGISLFSATSVQADEAFRQKLDQMLETLQHNSNIVSTVLPVSQNQEINLEDELIRGRSIVADMTEEQLLNLEALLGEDNAFWELDTLAMQTKQLVNGQSKTHGNLVTTLLADVDTESLQLESCLDQLALHVVATVLRTAFSITDGANDVVPANINVAGQSAPNPVKAFTVIAKHTAKHLLTISEDAIRYNGLCGIRNERKVAKAYIQARQVRYTPHKTIQSSFDVVRPVNMGGNKKYRYTFWMHLAEDGQPVAADVTKVMAAQLTNADHSFVTMSSSLYSFEQVSTGLYKVTLDTPVSQGLDFVRSFVINLEHSHTSPTGETYKHYGVAHIQSDTNSGDF